MKEQSVAYNEVLLSMIKVELAHTPEARSLHRLHCVLHVVHSYPPTEVADCMSNEPCAVMRWLRHFKAFESDGLHDDPRSGLSAKLVSTPLAALPKDIRGTPSACGYNADQWNGT